MNTDPDIQEQFERIISFFENTQHILNAYQSHQSGERNLRMSTRAMQLALGFYLAAGADGPAELARKCGVDKQTLGKCLNHFVAQLSLEPLPFQRKSDARANMADARRKQVGGADIRKCGKLNSKLLT
jgi:hypothetical protein